MAFLDKVSSYAKNAVDKTGDAIETAKLNSRINEQKGKISKIKAELGEYYWSKFESGAVLDDGANEICARIKECFDEIANIEKQIQDIKDGNVDTNAETHRAGSTEAAPNADGASKFCPECGTKTNEGAKFCASCGHKF